MLDLKVITDEKTYRVWKGNDWPSYEDFVNNNYTVNETIQNELNKFIEVVKTKYDNIATPRTIELSQSNQARQKQIFYDKHFTAEKTCRVPWNTLGINSNGNAYICQSPSWVPIFVGNLFETDDIYEILNSEISKKIRHEILEKRYYYCNNKICHFFRDIDVDSYQHKSTHDDDLKELPFKEDSRLLVNQIPSEIIFDFDYTCNFKCPSCRTEIHNWNNDHIRRPINDRLVERIKTMIIDKIEKQHVVVRWCGGEPFMSDVYVNLFNYIADTGKTNIQNVIQTNGSLFKSKKDLLIKFLPYISELYISFDAGCEETYNITRVGGDWNRLIENTKFIKQLIEENKFKTKLRADFVVQKDNYKDLPKFAELCKEIGITPNRMQKMWNWGTWDDETFKSLNVYNVDHPLYEDVKKYFEISKLQIAKN